jgi:flagellar biosynthesis protein FlhF
MRIRKYIVQEMPEAIAQIRRDLGKDAVILSTQPVTRRRRFGLRKERWLEVTAAVGPDIPTMAGGAPSQPRPEERQPSPDWRQMQEDLARLRRFVESLPERESAGIAEPAWLRRLRDEGLDDPDLRQLLAAAVKEAGAVFGLEAVQPSQPLSSGWLDTAVRRVVARLPAPSPGLGHGARVVAFIGPTGVGKTTTIAKIAALQVLSGRRRVGLVSADTFRIAAVDQLRTYAEILDIPMAVAERPEDAGRALREVADCDLVLVDTTGRSYRRPEHAEDTARWMQALGVDEIHLVLAVTGKPADLVRVARTLADIGYHKYLLTKLDETSSLSSALKLLWTVPRPVSYVTNGQNVPDDIEVADLDQLVREALSVCAEAGA